MIKIAIKDGELISSDEVLNAIGANFNDTTQMIFNADYIGFDSRLTNSTTPNLKNVEYSTFTSDDADVNFGFLYDGSNDLYSAYPITAVSMAYVDIYAASVNTTTLSNSANNTYCYKLGSGVWRVVSSGASTDEALSRIFYQLFFDLADSATDPNGVTSLTQLRCSESTYRGQNVTFSRLYISTSSSGTNIGSISLSLSGASAYKIINDYGNGSLTYGPGLNATTKLEAPTGTTLHTMTLTGNPVVKTGNWDDTESSTIHSVSSTTTGKQHHYTTTGQAITSWVSDNKTIWIIPDSVTPTYTKAGIYTTATVSGNIAISSSAPDIVSYPEGESTLIFKSTVTSTDNAIAVINSTIDATSSQVISISADGGSNWTDVNNAEIARPTAGTALWRRIVITRTDLSKLDKVTEQAIKHSFY